MPRLKHRLLRRYKATHSGGGLELALACDMLVAGTSARFGLPEVTIGVIPGAGGTQRLTRAIGKARAMALILTGDTFTAQTAMAWGVLSRLVPDTDVDATALALAAVIAEKPATAILAAKEAILNADELLLAKGVQAERRLFQALFNTREQKEGMQAFLEKRPPRFHRSS